MECEKIIADLDSLWFFSNIFSSSSTCSNHHEEKITELILPETPTSKQPNPRSEITESDQVEASDGKDEKEKIEVSTEGEANLHIVEPDTIGTVEKLEVVKAEQRERVEKRSHKTRRRGKENILQKSELNEAMGFTYFGFNFAVIEWDDCGLVYRFQGSRRNSYLMQKMPPLSDGMAMKEHLKSWAHAVACTVK